MDVGYLQGMDGKMKRVYTHVSNELLSSEFMECYQTQQKGPEKSQRVQNMSIVTKMSRAVHNVYRIKITMAHLKNIVKIFVSPNVVVVVVVVIVVVSISIKK